MSLAKLDLNLGLEALLLGPGLKTLSLRFHLRLESALEYQLECGTMPNVMAALLNIGGALCSTPQSLAGAH